MDPQLEVSLLSDNELRQKVKNYSGSLLPVTAATRPLLERRLLKYMGFSESQHKGESTQESSQADNPASLPVPSSPQPPIATHASEKGNGDGPVTYYGVQCPDGTHLDPDEEAVFTDQREALKFMKKYPGARFKMFNSPRAAECFAAGLTDSIIQSPMPNVAQPIQEKSDNKPTPSEGSVFRGPKPQDLVKLRKLLESGHTEELHKLVWSNPRYLMTSGDTPTILQEGFRYNALHSAALKNQSASCQLVIDTIEDPSFMAKMYPDDTEEARTSRISFLLDLYLNMPDKGNNETPLHFACKFGHKDVAEILASHPKIEKNSVNKYGETPKDVICSRIRNPSGELKQQMKDCLSDRYYVPLLRNEDNIFPAKIAKPWSPTVEGRSVNGNVDEVDRGPGMSSTPKTRQESPVSYEAGYAVRAFAGPMSPVEAQKFRKTWQTPPSPSPKDRRSYSEIRLGDNNKGLERLGRKVAEELKVPWCEYWDFLQCFVNIKSTEGLNKLERYLETQTTLVTNQAKWEHDLDLISTDMENLNLDDSSCGASGSMDGDTSLLKNTTPNYVKFLENYAFNCHVENPLVHRGTRIDLYPSVSSPINLVQSMPLPVGDELNAGPSNLASCEVKKAAVARQYSHGSSENSVDGSIASFITALDDLDLDYQDASDDLSDTPVVFLSGSDPSKTDVDVFRALENIAISAETHPHIHRWRASVENYSEQARNKWLSAPHAPHSTPDPRGNTLRIQAAMTPSESPSSNTSLTSDESSVDSTDYNFRIRANLMSTFNEET